MDVTAGCCDDEASTDFFRIMDVFFRFLDKDLWIQVTVERILALSPCSVKELWRATLKSVGSRTGVLTIPTKKIY